MDFHWSKFLNPSFHFTVVKEIKHLPPPNPQNDSSTSILFFDLSLRKVLF